MRKREVDLAESGAHDKSYNTDMNDRADSKTEKRWKIVMHENEILKNQLKTERQKISRITSDLSDEERRDLERARKQLERKNEEYEKLILNFDKTRIENVQLKYNYSSVTKIQEEIKDENEDLKKKVKYMANEPSANVMALSSAAEVDNSASLSRRQQVSAYEG